MLVSDAELRALISGCEKMAPQYQSVMAQAYVRDVSRIAEALLETRRVARKALGADHDGADLMDCAKMLNMYWTDANGFVYTEPP